MRKLLQVALAAACIFGIRPAGAQENRAGGKALWTPPVSSNKAPHLEVVDDRKVLFVDGLPFTVLTVETHWDQIIYGRYKETIGAYDYTYPAAEAMRLNALKVPVKWSMVEPEEGVYDFSYVDHARQMAERHHLKLILNWFGHYASGRGTAYCNFTGEVFAPMYITKDAKRLVIWVVNRGYEKADAVKIAVRAPVKFRRAEVHQFSGTGPNESSPVWQELPAAEVKKNSVRAPLCPGVSATVLSLKP